MTKHARLLRSTETLTLLCVHPREWSKYFDRGATVPSFTLDRGTYVMCLDRVPRADSFLIRVFTPRGTGWQYEKFFEKFVIRAR